MNEQRVWNEYIRKLSSQQVPSPREFIRPEWQPVQEIGDILVTPDGHRVRIERTPTVGDLLHVGDWITVGHGEYGITTGVIASINSYLRCPCPYDPWGTKICYPSTGHHRPAIRDYHRDLVVWGLTFVYPYQVKDLLRTGRPHEEHRGNVNELVAVGNKVCGWFEASRTKVERLDRPSVDVPVQLSLL